MIEVRCCHQLSEALPFRDAINATNLASARPDPFSSFEFYDNYLRHSGRFSADDRLWLLLAFADGELRGYVALRQSMQRVLGRRTAKLELLTAHGADRPHLVARAGHAGAVSAAIHHYLRGRKREWSLLEFQEQDAESALLAPAATAPRGFLVRRWPNLANGTIPLRWTSTAAYFAALSKKFRSNVSRQVRTLLAAGEVQALGSADPQLLPALFELYRSIEPHSWKASAGAVTSRDRQSLAYYRGLMDPAQPMRIGIQLLLLDGLPIAGLISGAFGKGLHALHIVHDDRLARLAPGSAVLLLGMRQAIEGGYEFFNLLRGFGYYKERWLAQMSPTWSLQVYRIGSPYFWKRLLGDLRRRCFARAVTDQSPRFNPARRDVERPRAQEAGAAPAQRSTAAERRRCAALIAEVRDGRGEFLSALALAAAMPFETRRCGAAEGQGSRPTGPARNLPGGGIPDMCGIEQTTMRPFDTVGEQLQRKGLDSVPLEGLP